MISGAVAAIVAAAKLAGVDGFSIPCTKIRSKTTGMWRSSPRIRRDAFLGLGGCGEWLGARRGGGCRRRDPKLAVHGLGLGLDGLDAEKRAAAVGKSFIGLDLTPLARKSRVFGIDSAPWEESCSDAR